MRNRVVGSGLLQYEDDEGNTNIVKEIIESKDFDGFDTVEYKMFDGKSVKFTKLIKR